VPRHSLRSADRSQVFNQLQRLPTRGMLAHDRKSQPGLKGGPLLEEELVAEADFCARWNRRFRAASSRLIAALLAFCDSAEVNRIPVFPD